MDFASYTFIYLFLPFYIISIFFLKKFNLNIRYSLIFFSVVFYVFYSFGFFVLLLILILINFFFLKLKKFKFYLLLIIIINLLPLIFFKYLGFIFDNLSIIFDVNLNNSKLPLPLGISFYTFQIISFQLDNYTKKIDWKFSKFLLYIIFFPQLISGPIIRSNEFTENIKEKIISNTFSNDFKIATSLIIIGLFKKVVLANNLQISSEELLGANDYGILKLFLSSLGYLFYVYFDFSGYSDIATGLARYAGYKLPINFNSPLKAKSLIIFWRNWHISLTRFLTDYIFNKIFYRLSSSKYLDKFTYLNLIISVFTTFALVGLWHGAYLSTLLFGLLNGLGIIFNHIWKLGFENRQLNFEKNFILGYIFNFITIIYVSFTMIFFRFNDLEVINSIFHIEFIWNFDPLEIMRIIKNHIIILLSLFIVMFFPNILELFKNDQVYSNIQVKHNQYKYISTKYLINFLMPILSIFIFYNLSKQETFIYFMF